MSSDLIFATLSRQGTAAVKKDEYKVGDVTRDRKLKSLNDEEKGDAADDWKVNAKQNPSDLTDDQGLDPRDDEDDNQPHVDYFA